jgi:hypothetical protein
LVPPRTRYHHRTITAPSLHHHCTITAPSLHHHCTITAPSLHHHCTITAPALLLVLVDPPFAEDGFVRDSLNKQGEGVTVWVERVENKKSASDGAVMVQ